MENGFMSVLGVVQRYQGPMRRFGGIRLAGLVLLSAACHQAPAATSSDGGEPAEVLATSEGVPVALAVDADCIYWVTSRGVFRAPKGGGAGVGLTGAPINPRSTLAVDDSNVYWATLEGLFKVAKDGTGTPSALGSAAEDVTTAGGTVYWSTGQSIVRAPSSSGPSSTVLAPLEYADVLAVDAVHIYWVNRLHGLLMRARLDGSAIEELDQLQGDSGPALALDEMNAYWAVNGYLTKVSKKNGARTILSAVYLSVGAIRTDGRDVFTFRPAADATLGELRRISVAGGELVAIVKDIRPTALALDDTYVYWAEAAPEGVASATIRRVAKR